MNDAVTSINADDEQSERSIVTITDEFADASDRLLILLELMWDFGEDFSLEPKAVRKIGRYGSEALEKMNKLEEELSERCKNLERGAATEHARPVADPRDESRYLILDDAERGFIDVFREMTDAGRQSILTLMRHYNTGVRS